MNSKQLLFCIGDIDPKFVERAENRAKNAEKKSRQKRGFMSLVACLTIAITIIAVVGNNAGWFNHVYITELKGGTLSFYKNDDFIGVSSLGFDVEVIGRELTSEENRLLFGDPEIISYGIFDASDKTLLHVDCNTGNTQVIIAVSGLKTTDWKINKVRKISEINGIQVVAGYFMTEENSQGAKSVIYHASFEIDGVEAYVECGGEEKDSDILRSEIASIIDIITQLGLMDMSAIMY